MKRSPFCTLWILALWIVTGSLVAQDDPRPLYHLPGANVPVYRSGSMLLTPEGVMLTANMLSDTVSLVNISQRETLAEIMVGKDPRTVALTPDNTRALVANRAGGTVSVINMAERIVSATYRAGRMPYAVVTNANTVAYVSLQGAGEVVRLDLNTGQITARVAVPALPAGLTLWGDFLYVTHLWRGDVSLIYLPQMALIQTIAIGDDLTLSPSLTITPSNGRAYLPQSIANTAHSTYDTLIFPVINMLELGTFTSVGQARIALHLADRPVNSPFAVVVDSGRNWLYVANAGSNDISVIDLATGIARAHVAVGSNPRDLRLNRDASLLFVHNVLDNTVSLIETRTMGLVDTFRVSAVNVPFDVLFGAQLFNTTADPRTSRDHQLSCANCHFDGLSDGRVWSNLSNMPRNTPALFGLSSYEAGEWGSLEGFINAWVRSVQAGRGFLADSDWLDLEIFAAYVASLDVPETTRVIDSDAIDRGAAWFEHYNCVACHGVSGDAPALVGLPMTAPYLRDGSVTHLRDLFLQPGTHQLITELSLAAIDDLVVYLHSLP